MSRNYPWEQVYENAVLETDQYKLTRLADAAQAAIDARLRELALDSGGTREERTAICDALSGLSALRRERIGTDLGRGPQ